MAMDVNAMAAYGGAGQMQVQEQNGRAGQSGQAGEAGGSFLETFRRLPDARFRTSPSGLKVVTLKEGAGKPLAAGMRIKVQYTGWLENGTQFDTSLKRGEPFEFTLGAGRVIKGWEEGLTGIKPGERRQIIIPPDLGYGNRQMADIPPGSVLVFNVEAVAVEDAPANPKGTRTIVA